MDVIRKASITLMLASLMAAGGCTTYQAQGGLAGGAVGGLAGALIDHKNPWRGGVIGAGVGALAGATLTEISVRGAQQAVATNRPVEYRTDDGRGVYRAEPLGTDSRTHCKKVREKVYEDGRIVKNTVKEICEGEKYEEGY